MINERLNAYFSIYKGLKNDKEILYYAMIDIALRCVTESKKNDVSPITDILSTLSKESLNAIERDSYCWKIGRQHHHNERQTTKKRILTKQLILT